MTNQDPKVLVTGATGFIGGQLAARLQREEGVQVCALARTPAKGQWLADLGVDVVQGDITDATSVRRAIQGCQVVYHAAAWADERGSKQEVWAVNVGGTEVMVEAALKQGVERFVHLSSCAVYGSLQQMGIDETTPMRKTGRVYHDSKVEAEEVVGRAYREHNLPAVSARPSQVYGPGSPQFTIRAFEAVRAGKVILIDGGKHFIKPIYIDNLVDALILCAQVERAAGQALNLSDGEPVTWRQFFEAYGLMLGKTSFSSAPRSAAYLFALFNEAKGKIRGRPSSMNREVVKTFSSRNSFSNKKAREILGWTPAIDFDEGMRRTEVWLRDKGYL
ncbi:MAG: NAD-dependent epimerase/dehydratase family protein [Chloroflexi bacterium]|nr:NAD-dependent epimerase/dehydratase family protein [Chloroflexota bacterium]